MLRIPMLAVGLIASLSLACGSDADSITTPATAGVAGESPTAVRQTPEVPQTGGTWSTSPPLPTARSEVAAVELDGRIYVFGGFGSAGTANEVYDSRRTRGAGWRRSRSGSTMQAPPLWRARST